MKPTSALTTVARRGMTLRLIPAVAVALLSAAPAFAATAVTLTFEGATSFASIEDFYAGGTDSAGAMGTDYGLSFTGSALALKNDELGPYFSGEPSPSTVMFSAGDSPSILNASMGLTGLVSFYYATETGVVGNVKVFSGLDGSGMLLASVVFGNDQIGCAVAPQCRFDFATAKFGGIARSVDFGDSSSIAFDNVSVTAVPEPGIYALLLAGLGVVGFAGRRRNAG